MILLLLLCGCAKTALTTESVNVQLKWLHQSQFAGLYVANDMRYYEDLGITIENFIPFNFNNYPYLEVQNKNVEFAVTGAEELLLAKSKGLANDVKAIAVIYKISPVCLYSLSESNILKPSDLIGKTVGIERAADGTDINVGILYLAMISKLGIDRSEINEITIGYDATELLNGTTDVSSGYVINEPHDVILAGKQPNIILPADYGVNMYADVIITHTDTIRNNPQLVENFLSATMNGWRYAIENQEETVDIVLRYTTDRERDHESYMLQQSIPLIHTGQSRLGIMEHSEWQNIREILKEQGLITNEVDLLDLYTNEFINRIYLG